ncbi:MAG: hypothetical protein KC776_26470 [Myxococcales bacterium]|nr:hypothetical protein [Myxococcales bacterium]
MHSLRRHALSLVFWLSVALAAIAGCGGGDDSGVASNTGGSGAKAGSGGNGAGTGGGIDVDGGTQSLTVEPATITLTVNGAASPASQQFTAKANGSPVNASWTLDTYDIITIDASGLATTTGILAGKTVVTATYNGKTATADVIVKVDLSEDVDPSVDPADKGALGGAPAADPGPDASKFLYPYDQTVMPRGLIAPLVMFSAGSLAPSSAKLTLTGQNFSWQGYYTVADPNAPRLTVPQNVWDAALYSSQGKKLKVEVAKALAGTAYGPYAVDVVVAPGSLRGVVYYQTYEDPKTGIWAVRPGEQQAAAQVKQGCVVCHSVAANGKYLATGADATSLLPESGVYAVDQTGQATQITGAPTNLGGDTRGLSFATFTPDGKYVMRSENNFWGGVNQLAWKIDAAGKKLDPATVVGLGADVSAFLPAFSPDGKRYAFTNGDGESAPPGTPRRSISVMDVKIDETAGAAGTLTFSNRSVPVDNGGSGSVAKFVTFLPDSNLIVLQEGTAGENSYSGMLPSWDNNAYGGCTGKLHFVDLANKTHIELGNANSGIIPEDANKNYEPFALPIASGGYYWVVFTSIRQYGNLQQGGGIRKQLWVAAITPGATAGADPSHPPFFLPNQTETKNERGFWALDPCKPKGESCETGDQCCDGFCRPSDPLDPTSPKVCGEGQGCSQVSEKCTTDADCCGVSSGVKCLGGFCSPQVPQ